MPIYTNKANGRLYVQFQYRGQTFKQTLPEGTTRTDARKTETKMRADVFFQANGMAPRNEILFEDFAQIYLAHVKENTPASYIKAEYICIAAKPFLKGKLMRSITPADIDRFKMYRQNLTTIHGEPRKPATVWRELSILSRLFSLAIRDGHCEINPVTRIEKPKFANEQNKVLPEKDEPDFLAAFDKEQGEMARDICILVLNTGLRQNDALGLHDFQIHGNAIRLVQGKVRRTVEIPLNEVALGIVNKYRGHGLLFPSPKTGKRMHYIRKAITGACTRVNKAREKKDLPLMLVITIRDLRRTFATRLAEAGVDALTIARLLGHSDLRMIHRYARSSDVMRNAVDKLVKPSQNLPRHSIRLAK